VGRSRLLELRPGQRRAGRTRWLVPGRNRHADLQTPGNEVLSSYPLELAIEEGLFDPVTQQPTDDTSVADCSVSPCAFYTYLQGTSMASPHVAGRGALIVQAHGKGTRRTGSRSPPDTVRSILLSSATDHACPAGGTEIYTDEGRPAEFDAVCDGTTANNGLYGEGIVKRRRRRRPDVTPRAGEGEGQPPPRRWLPLGFGCHARVEEVEVGLPATVDQAVATPS